MWMVNHFTWIDSDMLDLVEHTKIAKLLFAQHKSSVQSTNGQSHYCNNNDFHSTALQSGSGLVNSFSDISDSQKQQTTDTCEHV